MLDGLNDDYKLIQNMQANRDQKLLKAEQLRILSDKCSQANDIIEPRTYGVKAKNAAKCHPAAKKFAVIVAIVLVLGSCAAIGSEIIPAAMDKEAAMKEAINRPAIEAIEERQTQDEIRATNEEQNRQDYNSIVGQSAIESEVEQVDIMTEMEAVEEETSERSL